jgi:hypothetical protein
MTRAGSSFECEDIRMVRPDCDPLQKSSRNASCGAQYLLHRLTYHDDTAAAVADCDVSIAFTRWAQGGVSDYEVSVSGRSTLYVCLSVDSFVTYTMRWVAVLPADDTRTLRSISDLIACMEQQSQSTAHRGAGQLPADLNLQHWCRHHSAVDAGPDIAASAVAVCSFASDIYGRYFKFELHYVYLTRGQEKDGK